MLIISAGVLLLTPRIAAEAMYGLPMTQTVWNYKTLVSVVATGVLPGACACLAYSTLQEILGAQRAWLSLHLGSVYATVTAYWVLGEPIENYHLLGAAVILPGIYLASFIKKTKCDT